MLNILPINLPSTTLLYEDTLTCDVGGQNPTLGILRFRGRPRLQWLLGHVVLRPEQYCAEGIIGLIDFWPKYNLCLPPMAMA